MGNTSTSTSIGSNPTLHARLIQSQPGLQIYQTDTGDEFQKYLIPSDKTQSFNNSYQYRINAKHPHHVDVIYAGHTDLSCTTPATYIVVTERIPYRLAHLPQQYLENAVTILRAALIGFRELFKECGIMCVKDTMIGISGKKKVKVWLNPLFAVNTTQPQPISLRNLDPTCHQHEMVHNIFDLINSKADNNHLWRQLTHARERKTIETFEEALNLVNQFINTYKLNISDEVRDPFNKNSDLKKDENELHNSDIDQLQDYRLNKINDGPKMEEEKPNRLPILALTSPNIPYQIIENNERRLPQGSSFQQLKNKLINTSQLRGSKVKEVHYPRPQPQFKQPFLEIQKRLKTQENGYQPTSIFKQPTSTFSYPTAPTRIPIHFGHNPHPVHHHQLQSITTPPKQFQSLGKRFEVKFSYKGQPSAPSSLSGSVNSIKINLIHPPPPVLKFNRSASEPKPGPIQHITIPEIQIKKHQNQNKVTETIIQVPNIIESKPQTIQADEVRTSIISQLAVPIKEETVFPHPIKITESSEHLESELPIKNQVEINTKEEKHPQSSIEDILTFKQIQTPTINPLKEIHIIEAEKAVSHQSTSWQIKINETINEYKQNPASPQRQNLKKATEGLFTRIPQTTQPSTTIKTIDSIQEETPILHIVKQSVSLNEKDIEEKKKEKEDKQKTDKKQNIRTTQQNGENMRKSMIDSRDKKGGKNEINLKSSLLKSTKLPNLSYKDMRKMLLQSLQEY